MRVAILTDTVYPAAMGGMQKHTAFLAKHLSDHCEEVILFHAHQKEIGSFNQGKQNIRSISVPFPHHSFPGHYLFDSYLYSKRLYDAFQKLDQPVDFVYAQGFTGWYFVVQRIRKKLKVPVGVNFHGLNMFQPTFGLSAGITAALFRPAVRYIMRNADLVFSLGGKLTTIIQKAGVRKENLIEVPVGVNQRTLNNDLKNNVPVRFLFVGRFDQIKGFDVLFPVLKDLNSKSNFEFGFIGPIPESNKLKGNNVSYYGEIKDENEVFRIMREHDVLVNPSYSEGLPIVILEAMMNGLAILATDVGAVRTVVSEENGIIIEKGSKAALGAALLKFIEMPSADLISLKRRSVEKIGDNYSWEEVAKKTFAAIQKVSR